MSPVNDIDIVQSLQMIAGEADGNFEHGLAVFTGEFVKRGLHLGLEPGFRCPRTLALPGNAPIFYSGPVDDETDRLFNLFPVGIARGNIPHRDAVTGKDDGDPFHLSCRESLQSPDYLFPPRS